MPGPSMPVLYSIAVTLLFLVIWPVLFLWPKLRGGIPRRLGIYPAGFAAGRGGPRIWLHGASAGDLLALLPVYRELRRRRPDATFIVSTITNSGEAIARARYADADAVTFLPYDVPFFVRPVVRALRPDLLVLEYTEIWPNLIRAVRREGGKVAVTNGRFSERNLGRYRALFALTGNVLAEADLLLMREDVERERVLALGARPETVHVTGNTKFDALLPALASGAPDQLAAAFRLAPHERLWVAGSTHDGEEAALIDVFVQLRATFPDLRLVLAPRYVERAPKVAALAAARGLTVSLRSAPAAAPAAVVVLDTIGELVSAYRLATLVFVGGSFTSRGGQNILEPAACGRAVLFGPHMENFHDSVQVLLGRGGIQVNDPAHLLQIARELLSRPEKLSQLGTLARAAVGTVSGASERNAELLTALLPTPAAVKVRRAGEAA